MCLRKGEIHTDVGQRISVIAADAEKRRFNSPLHLLTEKCEYEIDGLPCKECSKLGNPCGLKVLTNGYTRQSHGMTSSLSVIHPSQLADLSNNTFSSDYNSVAGPSIPTEKSGLLGEHSFELPAA